MNKLLLYILGSLLVVFILTGLKFENERNKRIAAETDVARLKENQKQQAKADSIKYVKLEVTIDELPDLINHRIDSLIKSGKIKGKYVERIIERHYHWYDIDSNVIKPKPVDSPIGKIFPFDKWYECLHLEGYMKVDSLEPSLILTRKEFVNNTDEVVYLSRTKHFLFIKYGPWKANLKSASDCEGDTIKEIEVIRKRKN